MSDRAASTDTNLEINDLPPEETLTPEEKELLAGAGRYRLTMEALDARQMMDAGIGGAMMGSLPEVAAMHSVAPVPAFTVEMPTELLHTNTAVIDPSKTSVSGSESTPPDAAARVLFHEDFDQGVGTQPSKSTWKYDNGKDKNNHAVRYVNDASTLSIVADPAASDGKALALTILPKDSEGHMNSARITTSDSPIAGHIEYGRVEARIKLPGADGHGKGVWPAFWLLGSELASGKTTWPQCGEIDIMENWGHRPGMITGTLVLSSADDPTKAALEATPYNLPGGKAFSSDYHLFAVDWNANSVSFSVDGNVYKTLHRSDYQPSQWNFDKPFYIVLNIADNTNQGNGSTEASSTPQTMLVDYVRVYSSSAPTAVTGTDSTPTTGNLAATSADPAPSAAPAALAVAGPNALAAAAPSGYNSLKGVVLPTGPHLTTAGTINIAFPDGTEQIRYKETNPKMFGPTTADNGLWEMRLPVMAAQFLNGADKTDMIFLDAEVDPQRLQQLMQFKLSDATNTQHSLSDYFSVVNVASQFTGDRGAVLYKTGKYDVIYDDKHYGDNRNQTHAVAIDAHKSRAGSQAVEYISRFQVTVIATGHQFDVYLGKGPHNDSNGADFLTHAFQGSDPAYPGLVPANNQSMLDWISSQSGAKPAIMIGDWNNELNTAAVSHALKGYGNAQMFQNHYNADKGLDKPQHPGSNAEDLLVGKGAAYETRTDISKVNVNGATWDSLKRSGKLNTQVLSFSAIPVTVDSWSILWDSNPYGQQDIRVDPGA